MILDLRMQLEITIETRRVRRARAMAYQRMARNNVQTDERDEDEAAEGRYVRCLLPMYICLFIGSSDSWSTFDEESLESSDGSLQAA